MSLLHRSFKTAFTALKETSNVIPLAQLLANQIKSTSTQVHDSIIDEEVSDILDLAHIKPNFEANSTESLTDPTSNLLKVLVREPILRANDFLSLIPPNEQISLTNVIAGRFQHSLLRTNIYYLRFKSNQDALRYFKFANSQIINTLPCTITSLNEYRSEIKYITFPHIPSSANATKQLRGSSWDKYKISDEVMEKHRGKEALQKAFEIGNDNTLSDYATNLSVLKSDEKDSTIKPATYSFPPIKRSQVVIIKNFPSKISTHKILDFFWDLEFYPVDGLQMRRVYTTKDRQLSTFVLLFKDSENAKRCVEISNRRRWFYDKNLPIVESEVLDEDVEML